MWAFSARCASSRRRCTGKASSGSIVRDARNHAPLDTAHDLAAVLGCRLIAPRPGPLPWLPGLPHRLAHDPEWGNYLQDRDALVRQLADLVVHSSATTLQPPEWARGLPPRLHGEVAVWRAAQAVSETDLRPTAHGGTAAQPVTSSYSTSRSYSPASDRQRNEPTAPRISPSS